MKKACWNGFLQKGSYRDTLSCPCWGMHFALYLISLKVCPWTDCCCHHVLNSCLVFQGVLQPQMLQDHVLGCFMSLGINRKNSLAPAELWLISVPQFVLSDGFWILGLYLCPCASQGFISCFSALLVLKTLFLTCMYKQTPKVLAAASLHTPPPVCKKGGKTLGH